MNAPMHHRRAGSKSDDIRAAALRLFLRSGFVKTNMDAIAAAAGVSKQTVYRYYPTKSQLFSAVLSESTDRLRAGLGELMPQQPLTPDQLETTLTTVAARIVEHLLDPTYLNLIRVALGESREFPELTTRLRVAVIEQGSQGLRHLLQSTRVTALADPVPAAIVQRFFVGPLLSYLLEGLMSDPGQTMQRARADLPVLVRLFLTAVKSHH